MSIKGLFWDIDSPRIPIGEYPYLRFAYESRLEIIEVFLPDDTSYLLNFEELRSFLRKCRVDNWGRLVDFLYNFKHIVWNRQNQSYYPVHRSEIYTDEMLEEQEML